MSQGFVGSDIESVCGRARLAAIQRHLRSPARTPQAAHGPRANREDLQEALEEIRKRIDIGHGKSSRNNRLGVRCCPG